MIDWWHIAAMCGSLYGAIYFMVRFDKSTTWTGLVWLLSCLFSIVAFVVGIQP